MRGNFESISGEKSQNADSTQEHCNDKYHQIHPWTYKQTSRADSVSICDCPDSFYSDGPFEFVLIMRE